MTQGCGSLFGKNTPLTLRGMNVVHALRKNFLREMVRARSSEVTAFFISLPLWGRGTTIVVDEVLALCTK